MSSSAASLAAPSENEGGGMKRVVSTADFASTSTPLPKNADVLPFGIAEGDSLNQDNDDFASEANKEIQKQIIQQLSKDKPKEKAVSVLIDILPGIKEGVEAVVKDSFTECFSPKPSPAWNWNIFLFVCWSVGTLLRYGVLLPLRCIVLFLSNLLFAVAAFLIYFMPSKIRTPLQRKIIQLYGSGWLFSLSGVVKYHGVPPVRRPNQIYVANHTSLIDFIVLNNHTGFASVGQKHGGVVGFMQNKVLGPLGNIWFERFESRDRRLVAKRINDHISNPSNPPLLIFPEGVCVNNEYCVMFKKGVFDIENVEICPIAMKYNKLFCDPYWSSKDENFLQHILRIMKSWCLVCDVWFLEPQKKLPNETSVEFADRVKKMIADKAGLKNLHWDGYLKYYQPTKSMLQEYQKLWADRLKHRWLQILDEDNTEENEGEPEQASTSSPKITVNGEANMRQRKQNTP